MNAKFEAPSLGKRIRTMLRADTRRMLATPLFYIMMAIALIVPILIIVMTSMMAGTESTNPTTGEVTVMEGFTSAWQSLGALSTAEGGAMDLTSMCNINLMFFAAAVLVCLFISEDFRAGYSKNLFTARSGKVDYVVSKTVVGFIGGALMILLYLVGSLLGSAICSLSFALEGITLFNIVCCVLAKLLLMLVFVSIFVIVSVAAKSRAWLAIVGSLAASMLLFSMIPMITPLDAGIMNVVLCLAGGALFAFGLGAGSNLILKRTALV